MFMSSLQAVFVEDVDRPAGCAGCGALLGSALCLPARGWRTWGRPPIPPGRRGRSLVFVPDDHGRFLQPGVCRRPRGRDAGEVSAVPRGEQFPLSMSQHLVIILMWHT